MLIIRFIMALSIAPFFLSGLIIGNAVFLMMGLLTANFKLSCRMCVDTWRVTWLDLVSFVKTGERIYGKRL